MSRIGRQPVTVPASVTFTVGEDNVVSVKGPKGELTRQFPATITLSRDEGVINVTRPNDEGKQRSLHGLSRTLLNNMVVGVSKGFEKKLSLVGVGYKAAASGSKLNLAVGYSHPVNFEMPAGITVATPTPTEVVVKGADRQRVGQIAAEIRAVRPPEPYKGKGIRYADEKITIKETKKK